MRKLIFITAVLLAMHASAQNRNYHSFPEDNAWWNFERFQGMCFMGGFSTESYSITFGADTVIGDFTYSSLRIPYVYFSGSGGCTQSIFPGYAGAIRQDTGLRKVFIVPPGSNGEVLLYDFTLEAGDTVRGYLQREIDTPDTVISIDSILVGDQFCKRWLINSCYEIYLIEGIGSTFGLVEASPGCRTDMPGYSLDCYSLQGEVQYPDPVTGCPLLTSVYEPEKASPVFRIYPNPASGPFTVDISGPFTIRELRITDLAGNTVCTQNTGNQPNSFTGKLPAGLYILTMTDNKGRTFHQKLIVNP